MEAVIVRANVVILHHVINNVIDTVYCRVLRAATHTMSCIGYSSRTPNTLRQIPLNNRPPRLNRIPCIAIVILSHLGIRIIPNATAKGLGIGSLVSLLLLGQRIKSLLIAQVISHTMVNIRLLMELVCGLHVVGGKI